MALLPDPEKLLTDFATPIIMRRVVACVDPKHTPEDFKQANVFVMVGGGKGSGKSTLVEHVIGALEAEGIKRKYIAEIGSSVLEDVFKLPGAAALRHHFDVHAQKIAKGENDSMIARVGKEIFARARTRAYAQQSPIVMDYHMDDPAFVRQMVKEAKDNGYETMFASVSVTPETSLQRIAARQARTGRRTDSQAALKTHKDFATQLPGYFGLFDVGMVFDNNRHFPELIAMSKDGKKTVINGEAYEQATAIAKTTGGVAGAEAHGHHPRAMAGGDAEGGAEGIQPSGQGCFADRIAQKIQNREPPVRL